MSLRPAARIFIVVIALIAICGDWSGDPNLASLWKFSASLLLAGLAYESLVAARSAISLRLETPARFFLGRTTSVEFVFEHRLRRRLDIELAPSAPDSFALHTPIVEIAVLPGDAGFTEVSVTPRRLGTLSWPETRVRIAGVLGLAWWSKRLPVAEQVTVAPEYARELVHHAGLSSRGSQPLQTIGGGSELLQLRQYRPGDPLRVVDWKASARTGRWVSRDFTEDQHLEIVIAVDAGRASGLRAGSLDRLAHYVNVAARVAQHAVALDDRVGLVIFAAQPLITLAPNRGATALTRIRGALAAAQVMSQDSNPLYAAARVRSLVRHRCLLVLLTDLEDATVTGQLLSAVRLLSPKHLVCIAGLSSHAAEALAAQPSKDWLDPYRSLAAQEYCAGLDRKIHALRAAGAPALAAKPEQLERAVLDMYAQFRRQRKV